MDTLHIAIIMDGNGRWAQRRGLPRTAGHCAGARAVRRTVETAVRYDVGTLTLYAFSADNWSRPKAEVGALMNLLRRYLHSEVERCRDNDVRVSIIGRRDRLPPQVSAAIRTIETQTAHCRGLHLCLAIDYSSRHAIAENARCSKSDPESYSRLQEARTGELPPVDLLIRTGGEQRLSDFLLWESAYAEFLFLDIAWPDFGCDEFLAALVEFNRRERRFGRIAALAP